MNVRYEKDIRKMEEVFFAFFFDRYERGGELIMPFKIQSYFFDLQKFRVDAFEVY